MLFPGVRYDRLLVDGRCLKQLHKRGQHRIIRTLTGHSNKVTSVAFSPDGRILASGSDDHTIKLWDLQTGLQIVTLCGHESYVQSVAFSPDGKTLVSGGYDNTVKVWQVQ